METLTPEDIQRATNHIKEKGLTVRLQKFAGQSGDFFYLDKLKRKEIVDETIRTLTNPQETSSDGYPRIWLITTGLFVTENKLRDLLLFKDYLMVEFSVDPPHHNASGLCKQKVSTLLTLFSSEHKDNCLYLNQVRKGTELVKKVLGKEQLCILSVTEEAERERRIAQPIKDFFGLEYEQIFDSSPCIPHKASWTSTTQAPSTNTDLMFVDKVKGDLRIYSSFPDLLLGNPSEILTP